MSLIKLMAKFKLIYRENSLITESRGLHTNSFANFDLN